MVPLLFAMPGNDALADKLCATGQVAKGALDVRRFPDGETYVRILSSVQGRCTLIITSLADPDRHIIPILFAAAALRDLGAIDVGLVAPYLAYMRQDRRFKAGEGITSAYFAQLISHWFDGLVTVDPHLHRYASLADIYTIPTYTAHAAPLISTWIQGNITDPILVGPDSESEQWVTAIARQADAPHIVLEKQRYGDRDVEVSFPNTGKPHGRTPVLADDIISTARTMIETVTHLQRSQVRRPVCIGIHGIFADNAYQDLLSAGAERIITCNTISHDSNAIDVSPLVLQGLQELGMI